MLYKLITSLFFGLTLLPFPLLSQDFSIYVSDAGNWNNPPWQILKYDSEGNNPEVFIDDNLNWPQDILFLDDQGTVLISNLGSGLIARHDASNGSYISNFADGIQGPTRIRIGPDGLLYVLQWAGEGQVLRYELDGTFVDEFTNEGTTQSIGLDWDNEGNLYVSSYNGKYVRKYDPEGADLGFFIEDNLLGPTNIWFDETGDLLVADYNGTSVKRFDSDGNYEGQFLSGLSQSEGIAFLPDGDILVGNGGTGAVKRFESDGTFVEDFVASGSGGLLTPNAVVIREGTTELLEAAAQIEPWVYPNQGEVFQIKSNLLPFLDSMEVFNSSGRRIYQKNNPENPVWDALDQPPGIYTIRARGKDGSVWKERLVVTRS